MSNARDKANIPALNFSSTGIDDNAISTAITIDSSQRVGIGTTNPAYPLEVLGDHATQPSALIRSSGSTPNIGLQLEKTQGTGNLGNWDALLINGNDNTSYESRIKFNFDSIAVGSIISSSRTGAGETDLRFYTTNAETTSERMRIDSSGNVGIGTSIPNEKLVVIGNTSLTGALQITSNTSAPSAGAALYRPASNTLGFVTTSAERMRIDSSGNVGIGETAPLGKLHVKSADSGGTPNTQYDELVLEQNGNNCGMTILCNSPGDGAIYFGDSADNDIGGIAYSHFDNKMFFKVNGSERMRIDSSGNVLVGTTNTTGIATGSSLNEGGYLEADRAVFLNQVQNESNVYLSKASGYGQSKFVRFFVTGTERGSIDTNGSSVSYNTSSDYRLKENVSYDFDATSRLKQLKPARFNFTSEPNKTVDGFLAHEVSDIVPEAITGEKDAVKEDGTPDYQGIDQSKLVPLLVKTIQELEARITALETNNP